MKAVGYRKNLSIHAPKALEDEEFVGGGAAEFEVGAGY